MSASKHVHLPRAALLTGVALVAVGCGSKGDAGSGHPRTPATAAKTRILSSIRPGAVLSKPAAWRATVVGIDPARITSVDFLIDGKVVHSEQNASYDVNEEGNGLVPWLLRDGPHRLTVRVQSDGRSSVAAASNITVAPHPPLPGALVGTWSRKVTQADIARTARNRHEPADQLPPAGTWKLHVKPNGFVGVDDPGGSGGGEATSVTGTRKLVVYGPPNWLLPEDRQGAFCGPEPVSTYQFSVTSRRLVLHGRDPRCADRDSIFSGTWRRGVD